MQRTFGFDVLACPRCGGRLRLVALVEQASIIGRTLRHLGVPAEIPAARPTGHFPRGESVANTELFRRLAHALGRTDAWLFESDESMLRAALSSGHPWLEGITHERLWEEGYARMNRPDDWRPFANGGFATRSGKAELYSEPLHELGHDPLPWAGEIRAGDGLQLITGKSLHFLNSGCSNMARHRRRAGELYIEIHAGDARTRRVATGDTVRVWNARGEVRVVGSVSDRVRPDVAWMPFGGFMDASGARRSVNVLTAEEPTDWGGGSGFYDAFVEVAPVSVDRDAAGVSPATETLVMASAETVDANARLA